MLMVVALRNSSDKLEEHRRDISLGHQHVTYEIIWISRLALLSFGPAIVGSLLESIFIDSSLDPAIVGSVFLSICIACVYTVILVYMTLSKSRYTYHGESQSSAVDATITHLHFLSH